MKPEQDMICSLLHILGVKPPHSVPHPFDPAQIWTGGQVVPLPAKPWTAYGADQLDEAARRGGSENHNMLRHACGVAAGEPGADAKVVAWINECKATRGFDGNEVGCRNDYGDMALDSDLVFLRFGSAALKLLAGERLDLRRFWGWTGCPITGQRSAVGGREQYGLIDENYAYLGGRGPEPKTNPPTWDRMLIGALLPELRAAAARPLANPKYAMAVPTTFYVGAKRRVTVQDREVDANTDAVLVAAEEGGKREWAPTPPWGRIREQASGGRVSVAGKPPSALYVSRLLGAANVALPSDAKVYHFGSGTVAADGEPVGSQPQPPAATPGTVDRGPASAAAPLTLAHHGGCLVTSLIELGVLAALAWSLVAVFTN
jgi:hypothetical protein